MMDPYTKFCWSWLCVAYCVNPAARVAEMAKRSAA